jgi:short-subunit dehydrogenase
MSAALRSKRALVTGGSRGIGHRLEDFDRMLAAEAGFVTGASLTIDGGFTA